MTLAAVSLAESLDRLSLPLIQAGILATASLLCLCWRRFRAAAAWVCAAAFWTWLCCTPAFAAWLQRGLENQYPPRAATSYPKADAIVVLGGYPSPALKARWLDHANEVASTRVGFGYLLYVAGRAPVLVLSGGGGDGARMASELNQQGVPVTSMRIDSTSLTTRENALNSSRILHRDGLHRILLVTSAMHMPRALKSFRKLGFDVTPAATPGSRSSHEQLIHPGWWPDRRALIRSDRCLHEYFGLWAYELRGWA